MLFESTPLFAHPFDIHSIAHSFHTPDQDLNLFVFPLLDRDRKHVFYFYMKSRRPVVLCELRKYPTENPTTLWVSCRFELKMKPEITSASCFETDNVIFPLFRQTRMSQTLLGWDDDYDTNQTISLCVWLLLRYIDAECRLLILRSIEFWELLNDWSGCSIDVPFEMFCACTDCVPWVSDFWRELLICLCVLCFCCGSIRSTNTLKLLDDSA